MLLNCRLGEIMRKNPLVGVSICTMIFLILSSFSNVVGYQSVKSVVSNDSPLFRTKTQNAINQQPNVITFRYLGKGEKNSLYFPMRDNRTELFKRTVEYINKMDNNEFSHFKALFIQKVKQEKISCDTNPDEITQILQLLRKKSEIIKHIIINKNYKAITSFDFYTICHWIPGCIPILTPLLTFIWAIIAVIFLFAEFIKTVLLTCLPNSGC